MEEKAAEAQRKLDTLYQELNQKDGALASVSQQLTAAETKLRTTELTNTSLSQVCILQLLCHMSTPYRPSALQRLEDSDEALRLVTADRDRMSSELAKARDDAGALRSELVRSKSPVQLCIHAPVCEAQAACNAELERAKIQLRPQLAAQESTANRLHELASKNIMLTLENRQLQDQVTRYIIVF